MGNQARLRHNSSNPKVQVKKWVIELCPKCSYFSLLMERETEVWTPLHFYSTDTSHKVKQFPPLGLALEPAQLKGKLMNN